MQILTLFLLLLSNTIESHSYLIELLNLVTQALV